MWHGADWCDGAFNLKMAVQKLVLMASSVRTHGKTEIDVALFGITVGILREEELAPGVLDRMQFYQPAAEGRDHGGRIEPPHAASGLNSGVLVHLPRLDARCGCLFPYLRPGVGREASKTDHTRPMTVAGFGISTASLCSFRRPKLQDKAPLPAEARGVAGMAGESLKVPGGLPDPGPLVHGSQAGAAAVCGLWHAFRAPAAAWHSCTCACV